MQPKPLHPRRWRELRTTPENLDRLIGAIQEEIGQSNAGFPLSTVYSFHECTASFPAHIVMVSPNSEIRFLRAPGAPMFTGKKLRTLDPSEIARIEWRRVLKAVA